MIKKVYKKAVKFQGEVIFIFTSLLLSSLWFLRTVTTFEKLNFTIGQLALPVYLSDLDWSKLMSKSDYYGYGFKWALIPFYMLTDNPYYIYIGSLLMYSVLYCAVGFWTYKVAKKYWRISNKIIYALFFATVFRIQDSLDAFTCEAPLMLFLFIICILITYAIEKPNRIFYSIILAFFLCYLVTIHERAVAVTIGFIIIMAFYRLIYGKLFVNVPLFSVSYLLFYIIENKLTERLKFILYYKGLIGTTVNQSVFVEGDKLWFLKGIKQFLCFMFEIFSNILTLELHTLGVSNFVIVTFLVIIFWALFKRDIKIRDVFNDNKSAIIVFCLSVVVTFIVIVGMGSIWGKGISQGSSYNYKGCGYYRYFLPFFWPAYLLVVVLLQKIVDKVTLSYIKVISVLLSGMLAVFWQEYLSRVLVKISEIDNQIHAERVGIFEYVTSLSFYETVTISVLITFTCIILFIINKKWSYNVYICIAIISLVWNVTDLGNELKMRTISQDDFYDIYEYVKINERYETIPQNIYFYGNDFNINKCQIILTRYTVEGYDESKAEEASIIFSWKSKDEIGLGEEWTSYQLENDAYVFKKN